MTQEEKELLLRDLCGRLPYSLKANVNRNGSTLTLYAIFEDKSVYLKAGDAALRGWNEKIEDIKPYLRPMSSMTLVERIELKAITKGTIQTTGLEDMVVTTDKGFDYLNAHHFDYRGLIPMGLALESPEGMYKND